MLAFLTTFVNSVNAAEVLPIVQNGSDMALVFVHGLEGDPESSFGLKPNSWPDYVNSDDRPLPNGRQLSDADLFLVNYSDVFTDEDVNVSIEEMSQQVSDALATSGVMRDYNHVWFVTHSLGGIVIKRTLIRWSTAGSKRYLQHTLGVSLLGTPSNGAPLANLGDTAFGQVAAAWLGIKARHVSDLKTIGSTNTYLGALENDWAQFLSRRTEPGNWSLKVSCGYETKSQYSYQWMWVFSASIKIVPAIYANTQCDGEKKSFNKTHTELPKPTGKSDQVVDWLFESVRTALIERMRLGEELGDAHLPGALWRKIRLINDGHNMADSAGVPLIDQKVAVSVNDEQIIRRLRLRNQRYTGATWADLMVNVADDNTCLDLEIEDASRRRMTLALNSPLLCGSGANGEIWACTQETCSQ